MLDVNNWYMAGWSTELTSRDLLSRKVAGLPIVLYRPTDAAITTLLDQCCHRGYPLSKGELTNGVIRCGYHGLMYGADGLCIKIPGQNKIPRAAKIRAFPTVEQDGIIWVWTGDEALADPRAIVRFSWHNSTDWHWAGRHVYYRAPQELIYDNLLDLTHVGYVHKSTIGGDEERHSTAEVQWKREGNEVQVLRWMRGVSLPPAYRIISSFEGPVDRWQITRCNPGVVMIHTGAVPADSDPGDLEHGRSGYRGHSFQAITPETETTSHYFWSVGIDRKNTSGELLDAKIASTSETFEEDRAVIEMQWQRQSEVPRAYVDIASDSPSLAVRRILSENYEAGLRTPVSS
ncbi:Rieske 2Fe-2S domain-containing protein [Paraburkholderia sp. 40]|uniref:Rieske 2Fe-2S domain-containing protein n=1 Tax=Paraburkholderia sp. 40 TaxID=2991059 RepID=UPI003D21A3A2